jgi:hypothetical protein
VRSKFRPIEGGLIHQRKYKEEDSESNTTKRLWDHRGGWEVKDRRTRAKEEGGRGEEADTGGGRETGEGRTRAREEGEEKRRTQERKRLFHPASLLFIRGYLLGCSAALSSKGEKEDVKDKIKRRGC